MLRIAVQAWQAGYPPPRIATTAPPHRGDPPRFLPTGERLLPTEIESLLELEEWDAPIRVFVDDRELLLVEPEGLPLGYHQMPVQLMLARYGPFSVSR